MLRGLNLDRHQPQYILIEVRERSQVESVLGDYYRPTAALAITDTYEDILYTRKS